MSVQKQCILCAAVDSLNTSMELALDGGAKVVVALCDTCAEEATVKKVREAYLAKQREIEEVLAKARSLGLDLTQSPSGLTVAFAPPTAASQPPAQVLIEETPRARRLPFGVAPVLEGDDVVDTALVDSRHMVSVGGSAQHFGSNVNVPAHASHDSGSLKEQLPVGMRRGVARMEMVRGRCGQPIAIQTLRVDGCGTTRTRIISTNDAQLQQRAKNLQERSNQLEAWNRPSFKDSYDVPRDVHCTLCRGQGVIQHQGQAQRCPKCQGTGILSS